MSQRATNLHRLIKRLMGGLNYFGPVIPTLASEATRRRLRALDICTGNGNWFVSVPELLYRI